ncbi:MAG: hypothetical protein CM15mV43_590 [uncultured marine virus]|nr:MAG: hypothetical protein CM15mV43_590 [uncultured marine virus]
MTMTNRTNYIRIMKDSEHRAITYIYDPKQINNMRMTNDRYLTWNEEDEIEFKRIEM